MLTQGDAQSTPISVWLQKQHCSHVTQGVASATGLPSVDISSLDVK